MKANVNDRFEYNLSIYHELEVHHQKGKFFKIRHKETNYEIEILDYDVRSKYVKIALNGYIFDVLLKDDLEELIQLLRQKSDALTGSQVVLAPIPGLIKSLSKKTGDSVKRGEPVVILEAMKMENAIQAPESGDEVEYHVEIGDHVVKGQKLFTLVKNEK